MSSELRHDIEQALAQLVDDVPAPEANDVAVVLQRAQAHRHQALQRAFRMVRVALACLAVAAAVGIVTFAPATRALAVGVVERMEGLLRDDAAGERLSGIPEGRDVHSLDGAPSASHSLLAKSEPNREKGAAIRHGAPCVPAVRALASCLTTRDSARGRRGGRPHLHEAVSHGAPRGHHALSSPPPLRVAMASM